MQILVTRGIRRCMTEGTTSWISLDAARGGMSWDEVFKKDLGWTDSLIDMAQKCS